MRVWLDEEHSDIQDFRPKAKKKSGIIIACTLLLATLILTATAYIETRTQIYVVNGLSMSPTLSEGDQLIFRRSDDLTYGDVIVFESDYGLLTKRVIGLPGDTVSVTANGHVERNGQPLEEPYIMEDTLMNSASYGVIVEPGHFFVLGDNRGVSMDSRDSRIGQIPENMVCGRVSSMRRDINHADN